MLYGRVHWLDIAGYYADNGMIYRVSNVADAEHPWQDMHYLMGLDNLVNGFLPKPIVHDLALQDDPFEWRPPRESRRSPGFAHAQRRASGGAFRASHGQKVSPVVWRAVRRGVTDIRHPAVSPGLSASLSQRRRTFILQNSWKLNL